jgi:hypothetical protein
MQEVIKVVREINRTNKGNPEKISLLIERLKVLRDTFSESIDPDLILFGLAIGLEKISDYRIYDLHNDDRLNELNIKIQKIYEREGMKTDEFFVRGDPDTPEDYQSLNIEFQFRIDEIKVGIMREYGEEELGELFENDRDEYIQRYYNGWRVLEKDDPDKLQEIDDSEKLEMGELGWEE